MTYPNIGEINIGSIDGKYEFSEKNWSDTTFFDSFLMPSNINVNRFTSREALFIQGFRGTGKTSLLRYFVATRQQNASFRQIVLFKSQVDEEQRIAISRQAGATLVEADSRQMGVAQDFRSSWMWFICFQIARMIERDQRICHGDRYCESFLKIMGIKNPSFQQVLGYLPKIEGTNVKIKANIEFFSVELGLGFEKGSKEISVPLRSLVDAAVSNLIRIQFKDRLYIAIDELEAFFEFNEQFNRDVAMIRDLIFAIEQLSDKFENERLPIFLIAAVRSEVLAAIAPVGREIERLVHDRGVTLYWHNTKRSFDHPILNIIRKKIRVQVEIPEVEDPMEIYFDRNVGGETIDQYLLDRSFYRPRDIMWRLTLAQKQYPDSPKFSSQVLRETETEYSTQLWKEVRYELSARYTQEEIDAITLMFSGIEKTFFISDIEERAREKAKYSTYVQRLIDGRKMIDVCSSLYHLGALGNNFRSGSQNRNRWIFRGDPQLLTDQRMELNRALRKALSALDVRRGSQRSSPLRTRPRR